MKPTSFSQVLSIKRRLRRTWGPFFSSFGTLRPVQLCAIPPVLDGENVIVVAPTASGKTEAVVAPMVETMLRDRSEGLGMLYVSPTRALVNDMFLRLGPPLRKLGLSTGRRTGDRREFHVDHPENLLVTTPESLDSLLCRHPGLFAGVSRVVLDDIQLVDGGYRGDQLRVLLRRLVLGRGRAIQFAALSATLRSPEEAAPRYFDRAKIVNPGMTRPIDMHLFTGLGHLVSFCRKRNLLKVLLFANTRKEVELLSQELKEYWPRDRILVHHGSLSRRVREECESTMRRWKWGICVATTTLEIGIDIGDIEAVALYHPPVLPSSFQQRIGRGSRKRTGIVVLGYCENELERAVFEEYRAMALEGEVEGGAYSPDLSVVVQQIFSILFAERRGAREDYLHETAGLLAPRETVAEIVSHLHSSGFIAYRGSRLFGTEKLIDLGEKGLIHSNIPDERERTIVDAATGVVIGRASLPVERGSVFAFAGRLWTVVGSRGLQVFVREVKGGSGTSRFRRRAGRGAFTWYLPEHLQE